MPRVTGAAFLLAAFLVIFAACLPAAEGEKSEAAAKAAEAFESLYGKDWTRVKSTSDVRDDNELAKKLFAAAKEAKDQPEFLAILCEKACELAANPMGYATAAEALELEAAGVPEKASAVAARLVEIRQKQFDASKGDDRATAGEALMEAILPVADAREKVPDAVGAVALLRRALAAATVAKSDRRAEIEARLKTLEQSLRTAREIEDLKRLLEADPNKVAARERLVRIYIVDLDDPAQAAKWVQGVEDASLTKYVPGAAKPLAEAPEYACLELGEWYRGLAENAPVYAKAAMFARAQAYYNRFIELHAAADLDRTKAKAALQKIETDLSKAPATPPTPTKQPKEPAKEGKWIDILALVDPAKDTVTGAWERRDSVLVIDRPAPWACITAPILPQGDYELEIRFVRTSGRDPVCIFAPVGSTAFDLELSAFAGDLHGLQHIDGRSFLRTGAVVKPGHLENGHEYCVALKVRTQGQGTDVAVSLDGKPLMNWQGKASSLSLPGEWHMPNSTCLGFGAWNVQAVFRSIRLRMLSGEAKLLRPGEKTVASEKPGPKEKVPDKPGLWMDLLPLVDVAKDAIQGKWERAEGGLAGEGGDAPNLIRLPIDISGNYELQLTFVRKWGQSAQVALPVGASAVRLILGGWENQVSGLSLVNGHEPDNNPTKVRPGGLRDGHLYAATIKVKVAPEQARITVELDGQPFIAWEGPVKALTNPGGYSMPDPSWLGLGVHCSRVVFMSARLRMLSGEAKPTRPLAKPAKP